ncbi:unnamed protein product [Ambrosiozyma monospora]|uniref:Large ribosomal subunit protein mL54 n=1 Tax=Ambrosiozyma monospora TaxID=43982 RepID=A0A9W6YQX0_AMBMO|nr:unnamed protein product [Ambrosiozyma monospora]
MFRSTQLRLFSTTTRLLAESSCKEGTEIKLNIYKAGKPILAKKDEEYPEWLWTLMDKDLQLEQLKNENYFKYQRKLIKQKSVQHCKHNNFMEKMAK